MAEALNAVLKYGFGTIELAKIEAFTNKVNESSISLLKRCGFIFVKDFKEEYTSSGIPMDMVIYKSEG